MKANISSEKKRQGKLKLSDIKAVWSLLPAKKKPKAVSLMLWMIVGMVLEMLSVGLILPVIVALMDSELAGNYPVIVDFLNKLNNPSPPVLLMGAMLLLVGVYSFKNIYLAALAWKQSKFVFDTQTDLAESLFSRYLNYPYTFHMQRNSAELINNLQVELNLFIVYTLSPGMLLIAESLVVLGLASLLLYFEPVGAVAVFGAFLLVGGIFQQLTRKKVSAWGKQRQLHEELRMKHAQQGLGAVKDVKLYGKEEFFLSQYAEHTMKSLRMNQRNSFMHSLARLWLEVLAIAGLSLLLAIMIAQGKPMSSVLPVLGLFAAVSFRLMPSISRIMGGIHQLRFGVAVIELMKKELCSNLQQSGKKNEQSPIIFNREISLQNISYTYPMTKRLVLNDISLTIKKGEMVGFIGESGSGKSTVVDIILGLLAPKRGDVLVDSVNIGENTRAWQNMIGYVPQSIYLTDDTLRRNIAFGLVDKDIDSKAVARAIETAQLTEFVERSLEGVDTILGERGARLSGGQLQRIGIARALYHDPEILVLDEATSALDVETEKNVMQAITALHGAKTIVIVAHRLSTLDNCDKIFKLDEGVLVKGRNAEVGTTVEEIS